MNPESFVSFLLFVNSFFMILIVALYMNMRRVISAANDMRKRCMTLARVIEKYHGDHTDIRARSMDLHSRVIELERDNQKEHIPAFLLKQAD